HRLTHAPAESVRFVRGRAAVAEARVDRGERRRDRLEARDLELRSGRSRTHDQEPSVALAHDPPDLARRSARPGELDRLGERLVRGLEAGRAELNAGRRI